MKYVQFLDTKKGYVISLSLLFILSLIAREFGYNLEAHLFFALFAIRWLIE